LLSLEGSSSHGCVTASLLRCQVIEGFAVGKVTVNTKKPHS